MTAELLMVSCLAAQVAKIFDQRKTHIVSLDYVPALKGGWKRGGMRQRPKPTASPG